MPFNLLKVFGIIFHFAGMLLITLSFIRIAAVFYKICREKTDCPFVPKTKIVGPPFLIALGSVGFLFTTFSFAYSVIMESYGIQTYLRYYAMIASVLANLLILYGITLFYRKLKEKNSIKEEKK